LEPPQRDLSRGVADDEVIDRHISKEAAEAPFLSGDELRDTVGVALRDKNDAGSAYGSVHDILGARSGGDGGGHRPPPPQPGGHRPTPPRPAPHPPETRP